MPSYSDTLGDDAFMSSAPAQRRTRRAPGETSAVNAENKLSVYMKGELPQEIRAVAATLDRSVSWVLARAFQLAKAEILAQGASSDDSE